MAKHPVLIVEDDPVNINLLIGMLSDEFILHVAKSQAKALELLTTKQIDLILLDLNLPDGSGFEICKAIRTDRERFGSPSIIVITGDNSVESELKSLELGATDFVNKPLHDLVLKARMHVQLDLLRKSNLLNRLARIDGLTEVANRRAFDEGLVREWHRCKRAKQPLSLLLLDVDEFKKFNDEYGHALGDRCLRSLATVLSNVFKRASDLVCRYGGEEFAVIMPNTDQICAIALANDALQKLVELSIPHTNATAHNVVTFSGGLITTYPVDEELSADEIIELADKQLYAAKDEGRARIMPVFTKTS